MEIIRHLTENYSFALFSIESSNKKEFWHYLQIDVLGFRKKSNFSYLIKWKLCLLHKMFMLSSWTSLRNSIPLINTKQFKILSPSKELNFCLKLKFSYLSISLRSIWWFKPLTLFLLGRGGVKLTPPLYFFYRTQKALVWGVEIF